MNRAGMLQEHDKFRLDSDSNMIIFVLRHRTMLPYPLWCGMAEGNHNFVFTWLSTRESTRSLCTLEGDDPFHCPWFVCSFSSLLALGNYLGTFRRYFSVMMHWHTALTLSPLHKSSISQQAHLPTPTIQPNMCVAHQPSHFEASRTLLFHIYTLYNSRRYQTIFDPRFNTQLHGEH